MGHPLYPIPHAFMFLVSISYMHRTSLSYTHSSRLATDLTTEPAESFVCTNAISCTVTAAQAYRGQHKADDMHAFHESFDLPQGYPQQYPPPQYQQQYPPPAYGR